MIDLFIYCNGNNIFRCQDWHFRLSVCLIVFVVVSNRFNSGYLGYNGKLVFHVSKIRKRKWLFLFYFYLIIWTNHDRTWIELNSIVICCCCYSIFITHNWIDRIIFIDFLFPIFLQVMFYFWLNQLWLFFFSFAVMVMMYACNQLFQWWKLSLHILLNEIGLNLLLDDLNESNNNRIDFSDQIRSINQSIELNNFHLNPNKWNNA